MLPGKKNDLAISGGQVLGDEYSDHVIKVCMSMYHLYYDAYSNVASRWHHPT